MKPESSIAIPDAGITVLPPWGTFIVLGNKRHENRVRPTASFAVGLRLREVLGLSPRELFGAPKTELSVDAREFAAIVEQQSAEEPKLMGAVLTILNQKTTV